MMQIDIKHILRPWYFAIALFPIAALSIIMAAIFYKDGKELANKIRIEMTYMKDRQAIDKILSEGDKYLKVTTMYGRIHAVYGQKYHKRNNAEGKRKYQGLKKEIRTEFFRLCYQYSRALSLPYFDLITTCVIETSMNPLARTYWQDGKTLKEAGIFQHRLGAVQHAFWILNSVMPDKLRKQFSFKFETMRDLFDPINALKVAAVLFWGARTTYGGDPSWYVTSVHWGANRIWRYYVNGVLPPTKFVFNKGTIREDVRSPFTYYFAWNAHNAQFNKFTTKVYIDMSWVDNYKKACTKMEWQFIHSQKYVRQMINMADEMRESKIKFEKDFLKKNKRLESKLRDVDAIYRELNGLIKRGKFKSIFKEVFYPGREAFKELAAEMRSKDVAMRRKITIISFGILILLYSIFAVQGIITIIKKIKRRRDAKFKRVGEVKSKPGEIRPGPNTTER